MHLEFKKLVNLLGKVFLCETFKHLFCNKQKVEQRTFRQQQHPLKTDLNKVAARVPKKMTHIYTT